MRMRLEGERTSSQIFKHLYCTYNLTCPSFLHSRARRINDASVCKYVRHGATIEPTLSMNEAQYVRH